MKRPINKVKLRIFIGQREIRNGETVLEQDSFYSLFISFAPTSETTTQPRMI